MLWLLAQHVLVVAILTMIVLAVCRLTRLSATMQHTLWLIVLVKLMTPPLVTWPWAVEGLAEAVWSPRSNATATSTTRHSTRPVGREARVHTADDAHPRTDLMALSFDNAKSSEQTSFRPTDDSVRRTTGPVAANHADNLPRGDAVPTFWQSGWLTAALSGVWLTGSFAVAAVYLVRLLRIQQVVSRADAAPEWLQQEAGAIAGQLKVRRPPIAVSDRVGTPFVWCLWALSLVWPRRFAVRDRTAQLRGLLVHELAHIRRRDHWSAWLDMAARIVWWWNPLGWLVRRKLRESSELACDEWVVRLLPDERRAYAESLVEVNEQASVHALPIPVIGARAGSVRVFRRRLTRIMSEHSPAKSSAWMWPAIGVLLLIALPGFSWEKNETTAAQAPAKKRSDVAKPVENGNTPTEPSDKTKLHDANVARTAEAARDSVPVILVRPKASTEPLRRGLGVVLNKHGLIVTCQRLLPSPGDITVRLRNGKTYAPTKLVRAIGPFAYLKIDADPDELSPIQIQYPSELRVGMSVLAIGDGGGSGLRVDRGLITATDRDVVLAPDFELKSLIQTDLTTTSEHSGGPLLDAHGRLIGINPLGPSDANSLRTQRIAFFASVAELLNAVPHGVQLSGQTKPSSKAVASPERRDAKVRRRTEIDNEVIDEILSSVEAHYFEDVDKQELLNAAIDGMLKKLSGGSAYLRQEELDHFHEAINEPVVGVGIELTYENDQLIVIRTLPSSPAAKAGIQDGDIIEQIDRVAVSDLQEKRRLAVVVRLIRGKVGEAVTLGVRRKNTGQLEAIRIVRSPIEIDTVRGHRRDDAGDWRYMLDEKDKIGYIRIKAFAKGTSREIDAIVRDLRSRGLQGLVLDLRDCPGGLLTAAVETADLFVQEGTIVTTIGRSGTNEDYQYKARKPNTHVGFSIVVLVNGRTASAAEILAACLQDHGRATIAGERTFGRGVVSGIFHLKSGGGAVKLATASFLRPSGKRIHRFAGADDSDDWGVRPDKELEIALSDLLDDRQRTKTPRTDDADNGGIEDRQLDKLLEHLRGQSGTRR